MNNNEALDIIENYLKEIRQNNKDLIVIVDNKLEEVCDTFEKVYAKKVITIRIEYNELYEKDKNNILDNFKRS